MSFHLITIGDKMSARVRQGPPGSGRVMTNTPSGAYHASAVKPVEISVGG